MDEITAEMKANHESKAEMKAWLEETKTCLGTTEARIETGQEQMEAEIRPDLEEMNATGWKANQEEI
jgi:hypothetical protein